MAICGKSLTDPTFKLVTTLAIDTSTPQGSVAILTDRKLIFSELIQAGRSHSSQLFA